MDHEIAVHVNGGFYESVSRTYMITLDIIRELNLRKHLQTNVRTDRFKIYIHKTGELCSGSVSIMCIDQASGDEVKSKIEAHCKHFSVTTGYLVAGIEGRKFIPLAQNYNSKGTRVPTVVHSDSASFPPMNHTGETRTQLNNPFLPQLINSTIQIRENLKRATDLHKELEAYHGKRDDLDVLVKHMNESNIQGLVARIDEQLRLLEYEEHGRPISLINAPNPTDDPNLIKKRFIPRVSVRAVDEELPRKWPRGVKVTDGKEMGTVRWYNPNKGYGFIDGPNIQSIFVHQASIHKNGFRCLKQGEDVEYFRVREDRGVRWIATDVCGPRGSEVQGSAKPRETE